MNTLLDNIIGTGVTLEDNYMWVYSYVTKSEDWLFVDGSYDREYVKRDRTTLVCGFICEICFENT